MTVYSDIVMLLYILRILTGKNKTKTTNKNYSAYEDYEYEHLVSCYIKSTPLKKVLKLKQNFQ